MKIRTNFVTNSSSYSSAEIKIDNPVLKKKMKKYNGVELKEIENKEDKKIVEIIRKLDDEYGLSSSLKNDLYVLVYA